MKNPIKSIVLSAALAAASAVVPISAASGAEPDVVPLSPATTMWATRGLTQTASAEPMGEGRLTFTLTGTWYKQGTVFPGIVPPQDADVTTGTAAFSFGVNNYVDVFGAGTGFAILAGDNSEYGKGSVCGGIQGALPLSKLSPLHLAAQAALIGGVSSNQINDNNADGYDYFITRKYYDFVGRIMETLTLGNDSLGIKIHSNQGVAVMLQNDNRKLLLLGAGIQASVNPLIVIGVELNARTNLEELHIQSDPLWLTPSILFRTPYHFNVLLGTDVSLSQERSWTTAVRALEPFRLFGGFTFSFDLLATKRREAREKALQEKMMCDRKSREAQVRISLYARKAQLDSIEAIKLHENEQHRVDSMSRKIREDSMTLADLKKKLEEERSRRSEAEKQLLSTGMLLLDAVYFETAKAKISINSFPYLNIIGKMLAKYPKLNIEVSGHTDNIGKYDANQRLSQARAEAVKSYLIRVAPELLSRISAKGYGPDQPKASNATAEGRKLNRRTELQVLNKDALIEYN
jgi:outer membrane protein OmpA-like peptidoglycan-associated protein